MHQFLGFHFRSPRIFSSFQVRLSPFIMLAVASLKRSLEFDPVEQGVKRKRAEMKLSPPSSPIPSSTALSMNANPTSPSKQQQQQPQLIFSSSPNSKSSLVFKKPCSLVALSSTATAHEDTPMLTYAQTAQMCARLLREQDRSIREQYEQILSTKLTEQYDTFIRYTHDSVHKDQPKQPSSHRLFHFGQQQDTNSTPTVAFSYVS